MPGELDREGGVPYAVYGDMKDSLAAANAGAGGGGAGGAPEATSDMYGTPQDIGTAADDEAKKPKGVPFSMDDEEAAAPTDQYGTMLTVSGRPVSAISVSPPSTESVLSTSPAAAAPTPYSGLKNAPGNAARSSTLPSGAERPQVGKESKLA